MLASFVNVVGALWDLGSAIVEYFCTIAYQRIAYLLGYELPPQGPIE